MIGVFAGGSFDPKERVRLKDGTTLTLSQYAARCNIHLIRTSELNEKLLQRGVDRQVTLQSICRLCKNEEEVEAVLGAIWESPKEGAALVNQVAARNSRIFELEKKLATPAEKPSQGPPVISA